jgi:hypothetical protein
MCNLHWITGMYSSKSWVLFTNEKNFTERSKKLLTSYFPSQMEPQKELHYLFQVKDTSSWKKWRIREHFRRSQYLPEVIVVPAQKSVKYIISYFWLDLWDHPYFAVFSMFSYHQIKHSRGLILSPQLGDKVDIKWVYSHLWHRVPYTMCLF